MSERESKRERERERGLLTFEFGIIVILIQFIM